MALTNEFKLMELRDLKISKLLTDTDAGATYGTPIDVPGALKLKISPKIDTKTLKGDSETKDVYSKITEVEFEAENSIFTTDALAIIIGGTSVAAGTTPNQTNTYSLTSANTTPPYFKMEGQWTYAGEGLGDAHVVLHKCKTTEAPNFEINDASGNFGTVSFKGMALATRKTGAWYDLILNETLTPIATT